MSLKSLSIFVRSQAPAWERTATRDICSRLFFNDPEHYNEVSARTVISSGARSLRSTQKITRFLVSLGMTQWISRCSAKARKEISLKGRSLVAFALCLLGVLVVSSHAGTVNCHYDPLGRLTRVDYPDGGLIRYAYDAAGNRVSFKVVPGGPGVDSDSDGLPNVLEIGTCTNPLDADTDDDGILDGIEDQNHNGLVDAGGTDPCNGDTDGDGLQDGTELGYTLGDVGADTDKSVFQEDLDPTTTTDPLKDDTDGDRWTDGREDANHNGRVDPGERDPNVFNAPGMPWLPLLLAPKLEGRISVWFEPNPVPLYTGDNPCYTGVNEWQYTAYLEEQGGVGSATIERFTWDFYDQDDNFLGQSESTSENFAQWFNCHLWCGKHLHSSSCHGLWRSLLPTGQTAVGVGGDDLLRTDDYGNPVTEGARVYFSPAVIGKSSE